MILGVFLHRCLLYLLMKDLAKLGASKPSHAADSMQGLQVTAGFYVASKDPDSGPQHLHSKYHIH